ncbi:MAG: hypothetical protein RR049_06675, partial [Angelakisella sp.]
MVDLAKYRLHPKELEERKIYASSGYIDRGLPQIAFGEEEAAPKVDLGAYGLHPKEIRAETLHADGESRHELWEWETHKRPAHIDRALPQIAFDGEVPEVTVAEKDKDQRAKELTQERGVSDDSVLGRFNNAAEAIILRIVATPDILVETTKTALQDRENAMTVYRDLNEEMAMAFACVEEVRAEYGDYSQEFRDAQTRFRDLKKLVDGTKTVVDPNSWGMQRMRLADEKQQLASKGMGKIGKFFVDTGISIFDGLTTLPLAAISPTTALAVMGTKATARRVAELTRQGVPATEALSRGIVSGIIEAATEKIPLDRILKVGRKGCESLLENMLKQSGIEATEEGIAHLANYLADKAANDPNASFSLGELLTDMLGGGISGGVYGVSSAVAGGKMEAQ